MKQCQVVNYPFTHILICGIAKPVMVETKDCRIKVVVVIEGISREPAVKDEQGRAIYSKLKGELNTIAWVRYYT